MCVLSSLFPAFQTIEDHGWSTYKYHKLACFKREKEKRKKKKESKTKTQQKYFLLNCYYWNVDNPCFLESFFLNNVCLRLSFISCELDFALVKSMQRHKPVASKELRSGGPSVNGLICREQEPQRGSACPSSALCSLTPADPKNLTHGLQEAGSWCWGGSLVSGKYPVPRSSHSMRSQHTNLHAMDDSLF